MELNRQPWCCDLDDLELGISPDEEESLANVQ